MSLTKDDKDWVKEAIVSSMNEALAEIVMPQFEEVDKQFLALRAEMRYGFQKNEEDNREIRSLLDEKVAMLERDMVGVVDDVTKLKSKLRAYCNNATLNLL